MFRQCVKMRKVCWLCCELEGVRVKNGGPGDGSLGP